MKKFTLSVFALLFAFAINAQTSREVIYTDDFEAYTAGDHLAQSIPDFWTTWSNAPGTSEDATFSDEQAASGSLSAKFSGSSVDNILKLGNKTVGQYEISWKLFIPTGFAGYYNLQHFEAPGNEWAVEVYFDNGGTGYMHAGGQNATTFTYPYNQWFDIKNVVDLDADWAEIYFNDELIYGWKFSLQADGAAGTKQLGSVNFYSGASSGMTPTYYMDDITYSAVTESVIFAYDFDEFPTNAYVAQTIPEHFTTWSNAPGTSEDATFSDDFAQSAPNSVKIVGSTDLLLKLGNKTSGIYRVSFDYYVPTTKAGYFNIQHMEAPGNEWACEIYFDNGGTGLMHAGGQNAATFTYPQGSWFHIDNIINLDEDWAEFYINDQLIYEWQFSLQAQGQAGTKQLGSANFYAGASTGMTPTYYFDNVEYVSLAAGALEPTIGVDNNPILVGVEPGTVVTQTLPIENIGGGTLNYNIVRSFNEPTDNAKQPSGLVASGTDGKAIGEFVASPNTIVAESPSTSREEIVLHYDDEAETGIGFNNATKWRAGVRFPDTWMTQYNGMYLTSVQIFINEPVLDHKIQVYDMGSINVPGPGALLYEEPISVLGGWNYININPPVFINGKDLWVAVWMDQPEGAFPMGADAGPAVDDGRWVSSGPGWNFLTLDRNWSIRAVLNGDPNPVWMSVNPTVGALESGDVDNITITIDANGLQTAEYKGKLHVRSNDFSNELVEIDVTLTVMVGLNDKGEQAYVSMYPNPASNDLYLKANTDIRNITVTNSLGQIIYTNIYNEREIKLDLNQYRSGMYFVRIETANGTTTQKLLVH